MDRGSRLTRLDAFSKTVEDARVRTTSGGVVTIFSIVVVIFLVIGEIRDYLRIDVVPELIVDKTRGEQLPIHLNFTLPFLPCTMVTLDVMDISGEQQTGIAHGIHLTRLTPHPELKPISSSQLDLHTDTTAEHLDPKYCGDCYGAHPPSEDIAKHKKCCNTCDDVRDAYQAVGWAFGDGHGVEQCERVHYAEKLASEREEGCNIAGHLSVNKVIGNFHIAPGKSFSTPNMHIHDLELYYSSPNKKHSVSHTIHSLSFGPELPNSQSAKNPLDSSTHMTTEKDFSFMYFIKVVSTSYIPLGVETGEARALETHQYSVTSHQRSLAGGSDKEHPQTMHAKGGIPGIFFSYDISPMKVVNREVRPHSFLGLLTGICAIIGGTLTVATLVDRTLYESGLRIKKLHQG